MVRCSPGWKSIRKGCEEMGKLPTTMRPGVFTDVRMHSIRHFGEAVRGVAAVGQAQGGDVGKAVKIATRQQAEGLGVQTALYRMVKVLLDAGISPVYAVSAGEDYTGAFAALEPLEELCAVVSDAHKGALAAHVRTCCEAGRERIGVIGVSDAEQACAFAREMNEAHLVLVCDGGGKTESTAAAFAALAAAQGAQGVYSGKELALGEAFGGTLLAVQVEALLQAGVTPIERRGEAAVCVRALTTRTMTNGVADRTFSALSTVLSVDDVVCTVRHAVKARLGGLKNNPVTRQSIASQITVELEGKCAQGMIDSYMAPVVVPHAEDAGVCVAELSFRVAPEINQIVLCAEIEI